MNTYALDVFYQLLKSHNILITYKTVEKALLSHPDYPSLSVFYDVCNEFKIDSLAIETTWNNLIENNVPCIAHILAGGGFFVMIKEINLHTNQIKYFHPVKGWIIETKEEFNKKWSRIVFYVIPQNNIKEKNYNIKKNIELFFNLMPKALVFFIGVFIVFYMYTNQFNSTNVFLTLTKVIGILACMNLVIHDLGTRVKFTDKICNSGKHISCDDVINSRYSKFLGVKLSDISLIYFCGSLLCLFLSVNTSYYTFIFWIFSIISIFTVPVILISLYYQGYVLRKWCLFCLTIIAVLVADFLFFLNTSFNHKINFDIIGLIIMLYSFSIIISIWSLLKVILINSLKGEELEYKYIKLNKNPSVINDKYNNLNSYEMDFCNTDIMIGKSNANIVITMIINTRCEPCSYAHKRIDKFLEENKDNVKLNFRFFVSKDTENETLYLLEIYYSKGVSSFRDAISLWYRTRNFNLLSKKYPLVNISAKASDTLIKHNNWCQKNLFTQTPSYFFNNKKVDGDYIIEDLKWIVDSMCNKN